jgi:hypothetical protein
MMFKGVRPVTNFTIPHSQLHQLVLKPKNSWWFWLKDWFWLEDMYQSTLIPSD